MHIRRLRARLDDAAHLIETVRGFGYRFRAEDPTSGQSPTSDQNNGSDPEDPSAAEV